MAELVPRHARLSVAEALTDTRVVFLLGARQVGKSTLLRQIATREHPAQIVSLDERQNREAAQRDPAGFVAGLDRPVFIDEVQRGGPDLLLAIKAAVDRDTSPGQFLLTGSANPLRGPRVLDALTGRVEIVTLWPLSQAEVAGDDANFVDRLFSGRPPRVSDAAIDRAALGERIEAGGYPEARARSERARSRWFDSYLRTTFERDLESVADAYKLHQAPRLLRLLAAQASNLFAPASLSGRAGLAYQTIERYVGLFEATFLVKRIPAWRPGLGQREIQHPKLCFADTGLLLNLLGAGASRLFDDDRVTGMALENFVAMEVLKHAEWAEQRVRIHHYRRNRNEVDLVLENRAGEIVAVEVKSTVSLSARDWRPLEKLRDARSDSFRCGCVLHPGESTVPLGDRLFAVPVSGLWSSTAMARGSGAG